MATRQNRRAAREVSTANNSLGERVFRVGMPSLFVESMGWAKEHGMGRKARLAALWAVVLGAGVIRAQVQIQAPPPGAQRGGGEFFANMQRVAGEVTAISGSTLTVKTEDGGSMQVVTTDNTRVMMGGGRATVAASSGGTPGAVTRPPAPGRARETVVKISDLKVGDGVMAAGILDAPNKTLHAAVVFATDAAQLKAMKENLGKTYIVGRVTAIDLDNAKMTVERPDHVAQTIGLDETTSFRKGGRGARMGGMAGGGVAGGGTGAAAEQGGESITLADIKVGENVRGTGSVKGGIFVPTELVVIERGPRAAGDAASGGKARPSPNPNPQ